MEFPLVWNQLVLTNPTVPWKLISAMKVYGAVDSWANFTGLSGMLRLYTAKVGELPGPTMSASECAKIETPDVLLAALERADDGVVIVDDAHRITHFNAGAERIATNMMPPGLAQGLQPFFDRLASLGPVDRAFAVHFGELRATPERTFDARLVPTLAPLAPEPGMAPA